jgi:hypothetical protein
MLAVGRQKTELVVALTSTLGGLGLIAIAAPHGLWAVAVASTVQGAAAWPIRLRITSRVLGIRASQLAFRQARTILAGSAGAALAYVVTRLWLTNAADWVLLAAAAVCVGVAYLLALWLLNRPVFVEILGLFDRRRGGHRRSTALTPQILEEAS